jgi:mRNA-degrading endonuclease toxin of MazEF toxin-antitoxin module
MRRGEIWRAELPAPHGRRPVLLLSRDVTYSTRNQATVASVTTRNQATVASVTTRIRHIPVEVEVGPEEGLEQRSAVNVDHINTISLSSLRQRAGSLSHDKMRAVAAAIRYALALEDWAAGKPVSVRRRGARGDARQAQRERSLTSSLSSLSPHQRPARAASSARPDLEQ